MRDVAWDKFSLDGKAVNFQSIWRSLGRYIAFEREYKNCSDLLLSICREQGIQRR